jgi:hypothetical protein
MIPVLLLGPGPVNAEPTSVEWWSHVLRHVAVYGGGGLVVRALLKAGPVRQSRHASLTAIVGLSAAAASTALGMLTFWLTGSPAGTLKTLAPGFFAGDAIGLFVAGPLCRWLAEKFDPEIKRVPYGLGSQFLA